MKKFFFAGSLIFFSMPLFMNCSFRRGSYSDVNNAITDFVFKDEGFFGRLLIKSGANLEDALATCPQILVNRIFTHIADQIAKQLLNAFFGGNEQKIMEFELRRRVQSQRYKEMQLQLLMQDAERKSGKFELERLKTMKQLYGPEKAQELFKQTQIMALRSGIIAQAQELAKSGKHAEAEKLFNIGLQDMEALSKLLQISQVNQSAVLSEN